MKVTNVKSMYFDSARLSVVRQGSFRVNNDGFNFFDTNAKWVGFGRGSLEVVSVVNKASDFYLVPKNQSETHIDLASRNAVQVQDPAQGYDGLSKAEFFKKIDKNLASFARNERFTKNGINSEKINENIKNAGGIEEVKENLYTQYVEMCRDIFTKEAAERLQTKRLEMCAFGIPASIKKYCSNLTSYWPATFAASYLSHSNVCTYYDMDSFKFEVLADDMEFLRNIDKNGKFVGWLPKFVSGRSKCGDDILNDLYKKGEKIYEYAPGCLRYGDDGVAFGCLRNIGKNDPEDSPHVLLKKYMTEEEKESFDIFLGGKGKWLMNENESTLFTKQFFRSMQKDLGKYETVDDALYRESTKKAKEIFEKSKDKGVCVKDSGFDDKKFGDVCEALISSWAITQEVLFNVKLPDGCVANGKVLLFRGDPGKHIRDDKLLRAIFDSTSLLTQSYRDRHSKDPISTKQWVPFHRCIYNYMVSLKNRGGNQVCDDCEMEFGAILNGIEPKLFTEKERQEHITDAMFKAIDFNREHDSLKEYKPENKSSVEYESKNENVKKSA